MRKQNRTNLVLFALLAVLVMISACATTGQQTLTAKQQGIIWGSTYISEYDSVKDVLSSSTSTVAQRELALKKKDILTKAWPLIKDFNAPVDPINPATLKPWTRTELMFYTGPITGYAMSTVKVNELIKLLEDLATLGGK
jgi:hypothetical protein